MATGPLAAARGRRKRRRTVGRRQRLRRRSRVAGRAAAGPEGAVGGRRSRSGEHGQSRGIGLRPALLRAGGAVGHCLRAAEGAARGGGRGLRQQRSERLREGSAVGCGTAAGRGGGGEAGGAQRHLLRSSDQRLRVEQALGPRAAAARRTLRSRLALWQTWSALGDAASRGHQLLQQGQELGSRPSADVFDAPKQRQPGRGDGSLLAWKCLAGCRRAASPEKAGDASGGGLGWVGRLVLGTGAVWAKCEEHTAEATIREFSFHRDSGCFGTRSSRLASATAGFNVAIGRPVADEHYKLCLEAGVKIAGINAEVMPGQWEFQVGPCRGVEMGDHLTIARYIMLRVTESHNCICSFSPKPMDGDWNGAGCHTNFSVTPMREEGGYDVIIKVCEAFGKVAAEHIAEYGEGNEKRLTGKHETCAISDFKYGVANRGASIRIPRETERSGKGYMEDRRPAANCDPYKVTTRMMKTTGECLDKE
ncbi:unnamed protein product [Effrenium voratum]|nr:unnamed protein product [Effrenium voratum]